MNILRPIVAAFCLVSLSGCNVTWPMLDSRSVYDPIQAMGGAAMVYTPGNQQALPADLVANMSADELAMLYAPTLVQGMQVPGEHRRQWPIGDDMIGRPSLQLNPNGSRKAVIDTTQPTVYFHTDRRRLGQQDHTQLTYTMWYPAHPRTKLVDIEAAKIDSGVIRITLDNNDRPMLYETVLACGCYHKVFAESWVEAAAKQFYGTPLKKKKFSLEKNAPRKIDWEVAGVVHSPPDTVAPPVAFVSAGEHRVVGLHSAAEFVLPVDGISVRQYRLAPYAELYQVPVNGTAGYESIFNAGNDHQVFGGDRKLEKYIFMWIGTDDAGHPRRNDEILLHFDQSHWMDPTNYERYLRLPPGVL